ncbi:uncharacterized protein TA08700 [Theileria annulata]|uniref:SprT-like family, putative n=1 Tax=Theileria annulata TaxID=5874 RepID=Q4U9H8_THEAN|nr:uncharacterized protein TA08700 [Theileria annulata]CAI76525.1 hypothetical protein, conserved [Theileria annulata]|eukprot:XP_953150.1 hypothetical protein, conserved [Theileria annulata]
MADDVVELDSSESECSFAEFDLNEWFKYYNDLCFNGTIPHVELSWSKRMTRCAGICQVKPEGICRIRLSEALLKYRTIKDCKETLLHEMIHAYLILNRLDRMFAHGPKFIWQMKRINEMTGLNVTVFHDFNDEVNYYLKHIWRCDGICRFKEPFFGYVKRAVNRSPGPNDLWWDKHEKECGGKFIKISNDLNVSTKNRVNKNKKIHNNTIEKYFNNGMDDTDDMGSVSAPIIID